MKLSIYLAVSAALLLAATTASGQDRPSSGTCDKFVGPDKEQCLTEGGTVEAGMASSTAGGG